MIGQGAAARLTLGKELTWGTGVAVNEVIPFDSEGINKTIRTIESLYMDGSAGKKNLIGSLIEALGDVSGEMVFDETSGGVIGIESILRAALGNSNRDATNALNQYLLAASIDDSYTMAINKQVSAWEIQGAKINTLSISGNAGEPMKFNTSWIGKNLYRTGHANIVNAIAAITGITPSINPTPIVFNDLVFRIGNHDDALSSADELTVSGMEFNHNNNLTEPDYGTQDANHTNSKETLEPVRNNLREVSFKLNIPRYISDQMMTWNENHTPLQCDFIWTNGSYNFKILVPNFYVTKVNAPIADAGVIKQEVECMAIRNSGTNSNLTLTDSTAIANEFAIEAKSGRATAA